jgi:hypothetical protein
MFLLEFPLGGSSLASRTGKSVASLTHAEAAISARFAQAAAVPTDLESACWAKCGASVGVQRQRDRPACLEGATRYGGQCRTGRGFGV